MFECVWSVFLYAAVKASVVMLWYQDGLEHEGESTLILFLVSLVFLVPGLTRVPRRLRHPAFIAHLPVLERT